MFGLGPGQPGAFNDVVNNVLLDQRVTSAARNMKLERC
jgi:hypothetical protein